MNWLLSATEELLPVIVFFVIQAQVGFIAGISAMTVTVALLLVLAFSLKRSVPKFAIFSTGAVLVFAIPSIVTGEGALFQLADTVVDGLFALVLLGSWFFKFPLLKVFFDGVFAVTDNAWQALSFRWGLLFLALAILNEVIRQTYTTDVWSLYKLVSTIGILLFGCYQFTLSARERIVGESNRIGLRI